MRWVLLGLPTFLLVCLILVLSGPQAAPTEVTDEEVSREPLPDVGPQKSSSAAANKEPPKTFGTNQTDSNQPRPRNPDPVAFLEKCLKRYDREVTSYSAILAKQERIGGKLQKPEEIQVCFREHPFGVYLQWLQGARKAERVLYAAGENKGQMLARPRGMLIRKLVGEVVARDPEGSDARQSGRYTLKEFGIKKGTERLLAAWKRARARGALHVEYLGVHKVKELDDRECYKLRRTQFDRPEEDGMTETIVYIDKKSWLQIGTILNGEDSEGKPVRIAVYFFRALRLNPRFKPNQFKPSALIP